MTALIQMLGRYRWLHRFVALFHVYPIAGLLLRRVPVYGELKPSGLVYRVTSLDQISVEYGMFKREEYASALENHLVETFIDLGCNAGWFALWLAANGTDRSCHGLLVDAHPLMAAEASWHMERNGLTNCAVVYGAVGLEPGQSSTTFHMHPSSVGSSVVPFQPKNQYSVKGRIIDITVPAVTVSLEWQDRFDDMSVDLMKVDIEGKELDFFVYESKFLQQRVRRIIVEWHKWCTSLTRLDEQLMSIGYKRRGVSGETDMVGIATFDNVGGAAPRGRMQRVG